MSGAENIINNNKLFPNGLKMKDTINDHKYLGK